MIRVEKVSKHYRLGQSLVKALNDVNLRIESGAFCAIVGSSGSGKSTLLNLLGCLDTPSSGRVKILDQYTDELSDKEQAQLRNHHIGFIFQSFNLIPVLSAFENVEYPLRLQNIPNPERKQRVNELLEQVGLQQHRKHRPDNLSGGQRQRVAIARALVTRPQLVLADEPTANLDSVTGTEILDLMQNINQEHSTSFIFSTHDPKISQYAKTIYHLQDGVLNA